MATHHSNDGSLRLDPEYASRHAPLDGFPEPPPWMGDAICATTDPEAFFPEKGGSTREAKAICHRCTVQAECLDWALDRDERFGIWGGLSERQRRKIKVPRRCATCQIEIPQGKYCGDHSPSNVVTGPSRRNNWSAPSQGAIRQWAAGKGIRVAPIGNIARSVVDQYLAEHPHDPAIHEHNQESA